MGSQSVTAIKSQKDRKEFLSHLLNDIEAFNYMLVNNLFESDVISNFIIIYNNKYI